jgi:hypothetical protein
LLPLSGASILKPKMNTHAMIAHHRGRVNRAVASGDRRRRSRGAIKPIEAAAEFGQLSGTAARP